MEDFATTADDSRRGMYYVLQRFLTPLTEDMKSGMEKQQYHRYINRHLCYGPAYLQHFGMPWVPLREPREGTGVKSAVFTYESDLPWNPETVSIEGVRQAFQILNEALDFLMQLPDRETVAEGLIWWPVEINGSFSEYGKKLQFEIIAHQLRWRDAVVVVA